MNNLYVQIHKSSIPTFWYAKHIGDIFSVEEYDDKDYLLSKGHLGFISKKDCNIVNVDAIPEELVSRRI